MINNSFMIISLLINNSFMIISLMTSFGQGNITPIQKPKKVLGPPENVRPVTIVTCSRELLSVIVLKRIQNKLDMRTQCAYKRERSFGDIVWYGQYE